MNAEIIAVGTEILLGSIVNTNEAYLSRRIALLGINVYYQSTVGDNPSRLTHALKLGMSRSDIVFTMGGLGPTVDDITLLAIARACDRELCFEKKILRDIKAYFRKGGIKKIPPDAVRQAYIPEGAKWFKNELGTAPGIFLKSGGKVVIALPGPPRELAPMFEKYIEPYFRRKGYAGDWTIKTLTLKATGMVEADVNSKVKDILSLSGDTTVGIYARPGEVDLKITAKASNGKKADKAIKAIEKRIRKRIAPFIYGVNDETLESVIASVLKSKKKTLAVAESCTGGHVADRLTDISGSSDYFMMGVAAYSNRAKEKLLSVPSEDLKKFGAVSRVVAYKMARGIRDLSDADIGLGITGIAGPSGGSKDKPVGLVYISVVSGKKAVTKEFRFAGTRADIKRQASIAALDLLRKFLA